MTFPAQHRVKLHSTNPLERLNKEVKRRADEVGIFANEQSIIRLNGAILLEQNDEWQLQSRYMRDSEQVGLGIRTKPATQFGRNRPGNSAEIGHFFRISGLGGRNPRNGWPN